MWSTKSAFDFWHKVHKVTTQKFEFILVKCLRSPFYYVVVVVVVVACMLRYATPYRRAAVLLLCDRLCEEDFAKNDWVKYDGRRSFRKSKIFSLDKTLAMFAAKISFGEFGRLQVTFFYLACSPLFPNPSRWLEKTTLQPLVFCFCLKYCLQYHKWEDFWGKRRVKTQISADSVNFFPIPQGTK